MTSIVNLFAVADGNNRDQSGVFDENNAPITSSKPAPCGAFEPLHIA
jgi:hypothetical protein